jgi:hypothetical protein
MAVGAYSADQQRKAANTAADQAKANAQKAQQQADEQTNAANAKAPNVSAIQSAVEVAAKGGAGSTMLTGPAGIDPSSLTLGKSTLLGGAPAPGG